MDIHFRSIGKIHVKATDAEVREKGDIEGELEINPEFAEALDGIDGYSHLFVIVYFDRLRPEQIGPLKVKPRGLLRKGFKLEDLPLLGVFAWTRRLGPIPIGLTLVRFRNGTRLFVRGLDFLNGTPILDIKGYRAQYRTDQFTIPEWSRNLVGESGDV